MYSRVDGSWQIVTAKPAPLLLLICLLHFLANNRQRSPNVRSDGLPLLSGLTAHQETPLGNERKLLLFRASAGVLLLLGFLHRLT